MPTLSNAGQKAGQAKIKGKYVFDLVIYPVNGNFGAVGKKGWMNYDGLGNVTQTFDVDGGGEIRLGLMNSLEYTLDPAGDGSDPNVPGTTGRTTLRWHRTSFPWGNLTTDPNLLFATFDNFETMVVKADDDNWSITGTLVKAVQQ